MSNHLNYQNEDMGEIVKRKNIGEETMRESQEEMENNKVERLSETIFMLMLELNMSKKKCKSLEAQNLNNTEFVDTSTFGLGIRERLDHYKNLSEGLQSENSNLRFKLDKFKNVEIENNYYKDNFAKIEELYMLEQRKRKFLEERLGELNSQEISRIEETFEENFKYLKYEEKHIKTTEIFEEEKHTSRSENIKKIEHSKSRTNRVGTFYVQPTNFDIRLTNNEEADSYIVGNNFSGNLDSPSNPNDISLLSKNIQKKIKEHPDNYNLKAKELEREIYILSKEVDRLNIENQKYIEENLIMAQTLKEAEIAVPEFLSDKFGDRDSRDEKYMFNSHDMKNEGVSELVGGPGEIMVPNDKHKFNQLLSNDTTFFLKERISKLQDEIEVYVDTIKDLEDDVDELKKKNIRLQNENRVIAKDNFRESQKIERENHNLKEKLDEMHKRTSENVFFITDTGLHNHKNIFSLH